MNLGYTLSVDYWLSVGGCTLVKHQDRLKRRRLYSGRSLISNVMCILKLMLTFYKFEAFYLIINRPKKIGKVLLCYIKHICG